MKTRSFLLSAGFVLALAFTFSCDSGSSDFVGKWLAEDGSESMELFKDGTGVVQANKGNQKASISISWKLVENKRFVVTSTVRGSLVSKASDYEISGKKLTLTDDKGEKEIYVKPQEGKIEGKTLTDKRDGKKYKTVIIGERTWMAENLNFEANGSKCYDDKPENCGKYGRLYDWNTAKEACPSGWHLPSDEEWKIDGYVGGDAGKKLKSKSGWNNYRNKDGNGTDDFGFSALPGGYFSVGLEASDLRRSMLGGKGGSKSGSHGSFNGVGENGSWWSANEDAYSMDYYSDNTSTSLNNFFESSLYSVRCLKD
jgi:uncharacterized protein (TIGR02145 family)